jgi:hypothetical protein
MSNVGLPNLVLVLQHMLQPKPMLYESPKINKPILEPGLIDMEIKTKIRHEEKSCPACRKSPLSEGFTGNFCRNEDCIYYKIQI